MKNVRRLMAGAVIVGLATLGTVGVASAQTTSPSTPTQNANGAQLCDKAKARLPKLEERTTNNEARQAKVEANIAKATAAGKTDLAQKLQTRLGNVKGRHDKIVDLIAKINARCG